MLAKLLKILRGFSKTERIVFLAAFLIFVLTAFFALADYVDKNTVRVPVRGGEYREGVVGQPSFVNPVLVSSDADRDLSTLLFGNVLDLADSYKMSPDGKTWTIRLKDNVVWDDGTPITSDDVLFTLDTIENPDSRSLIYPVWKGVLAQRVSEREFKLVLPTPYAYFEKNLAELRPIPKHIFGALPAANLQLSNYVLEPVGSGPFKYSNFEKRKDGFITEYYLVPNEKYFGKKPYLGQLTFRFYEDQKSLEDAFNNGAIDGMGNINPKDLDKINVSHTTYDFKMPKYYAIFLNQNSNQALQDKNVRLALDYAVDKNEIVQKVFVNFALSAEGPMVPGMEGYAPGVYPSNQFSIDKANQVLDASGWQMGSNGVRSKNLVVSSNQNGLTLQKQTTMFLEFHLAVPDTQFLVDTANIVRDDWAKVGIKLDLDIQSAQDINENDIKTRNYEMILFGNIFGNNPDLFSFWHSSESFYPGLNLASYNNQTSDALLESIRKDLNDDQRQIDLTSLQSAIINDAPAVFLFSPSYLYISKTWLEGVNLGYLPLPSDRFQNVSDWYIKTARVFK